MLRCAFCVGLILIAACKREVRQASATVSATRYPVVFVHGFAGSKRLFHFAGVKSELERMHVAVFETEVPPFAPVTERARRLAERVETILSQTHAGKVNIVAHSMGGLDARELISTLGYGDRVASVTTISTPHRGTHAADAALDMPDNPQAARAINEALTWLGAKYNASAPTAEVRGALRNLSTRGAAEFNRTHPNDPRVFYQSWAGVANVPGVDEPVNGVCGDAFKNTDNMHALLAAPALIVGGIKRNGEWLTTTPASMEPNDGFVTVVSARWGVFQGCVAADHLDEVGDEIMGDSPSFNRFGFYGSLITGLAARGY